jgi:hypothetical protein
MTASMLLSPVTAVEAGAHILLRAAIFVCFGYAIA